MLSDEHDEHIYGEGVPERLRRDEDLRELNEGPLRRRRGRDRSGTGVQETDAERRRRVQMEGLRQVMAETRKARTTRVEPPPPHDGHAKDPRTAAVSPTPVREDEDEEA